MDNTTPLVKRFAGKIANRLPLELFLPTPTVGDIRTNMPYALMAGLS